MFPKFYMPVLVMAKRTIEGGTILNDVFSDMSIRPYMEKNFEFSAYKFL